MRRSKIEIYLHLVWATQDRYPFLVDPVERAMHRMMQQAAESLKCDVLAIDGMPDHVHMLLSIPATLAAAELARKLKGPSSSFANTNLSLPYHFSWQDNYGAFSVSGSHISRVVRYIQTQREHHSTGTEWPEWEETFLEFDPT